MKALETVFVASLLVVSASGALAREPSARSIELALSVPDARPAASLPRTPLDLAFACWVERASAARLAERLPEAPAPLSHERIVLTLEAPRVPGFDGRGPLVRDVLDELPLLGSAWAFAGSLVPTEVDGVVRAMTIELGGDSVRLPDVLREFAGALAHGPYSRSDDANGTAITIDIRLVLAWRPDERFRIEAGYAVAYASGEYGAQLDGSHDPAGHRSDFLRHGPWAAVGLEF